ncbi:MAG TPA: valine--tRNA ligase [Chlamydiales bacterium]|nr:valine--tRNA ligase [Chlamydiales bacterium]
MTSLSKTYDPKLVEEKWYSFWEEKQFFRANSDSKKESFSIVIPPPNVTGKLHMGHALVDTIQDILIRWKRMQGYVALWVPGTDHAGIATQGVVEKMLYAKTGKRRKDFDREEFLKHVWDWKEKSENEILSQIKKLGCSCDWSRLRFTMDEGCNEAVRVCFKKMFDEGLIYRGDYLVNWDPVTQTALSDDEVEHEERSSFLWHLRYPLENNNGYIVVATTRPETMLGDTAVAVHPEDPRYKSFIGQNVILPITQRKIPIIADHFVDPTFGSGAVKITPAHDFNDFEMGQRHNLPRINILTPDAKIKEGKFAGLNVEEAREKIVEELKTLGNLERVEPHVLRVGVSYRSKATLQPYLSKQWFVKMSHFKKQLISAVKEKRVTLIPAHWEQTYFHWIENLRDWCISRQLWWGHRIPIWYKGDQMVCYDGEGVPPGIDSSWTQDPDVLDTWFSSALWPLSTLGWPNQTQDLKKFYPTSVLVTAHDILFFWVARMIMMGEYLTGEVPFYETFLHGLIYGKSYWKTGLDGSVTYITGEEKKKYDLGEALPKDVESKWEKMSKTKGNVIDPIAMIDEYGTDAVRFTLCSSTTHARQIDLDQRRFEEYKNFANKLWNGARFVLMNVETLSPVELSSGLNSDLFALEDRWILSILNRTVQEINRSFDTYAFDKAATRAYEFFWNDFCATYVELSKPVLFGKIGSNEEKINKQKLLLVLLVNAIRLLHPITPFITEEIFQNIKYLFPKLRFRESDNYTEELIKALLSDACIVAPFPKVFSDEDMDEQVETDFAFMMEHVRTIRNIRTEMQIPPSEKTDLYVIGSESQRLQQHQKILLSLTPTSNIVFTDQEPTAFGATGSIGLIKLFIPIPESLKEKEKARLKKEEEKLEKLLANTRAKLNNAEFRARAPQEIVQNLEQTLDQTQKQLHDLQNKQENI